MTERPHWLGALDASHAALVTAAPHPRRVEPMLAVASSSSRPARELHERKLDGMRLLVHLDGGQVRLRTRTHEERARGFPELVDALAALGARDVVADGEVVAFDGEVTSFSRLQGRIALNDPVRARLTGIAVHLYLFDLLHLDGHDLRALPLHARKHLLERELTFTDPLRFTTHVEGDPATLLREACEQGWEGLISKDADAPYRAGRSSAWRKRKCDREADLVVAGWTEPRGARSGFGSLLLGYHEGARLRYAGKVGTGFGQEALTVLTRWLREHERSTPAFADPPAESGVHWVEPLLVAKVGFTEWTRDGRLRHPRFQGLRTDRRPQDVVREDG